MNYEVKILLLQVNNKREYMCLYCKNNKRIAEKDILCYKVLAMTETGDYISPYKDFPYELGKLVQSSLIYDDESKHVDIGLHTYKCLFDAKALAVIRRNYFVFEAVIPKGSQYFEGEDLSRGKSYASDKLIIKYKKN